jgi:hypothetical protein
MKKYAFLMFIAVGIFINNYHSYPQCAPDAVNCIDTLDPGQICPDSVPDGFVNESYQVTITVIPPYEQSTQSGPVKIVKIIIDSVGNIPPGLSYQKNAEEFYVDSIYCILVSGTPTTPGTYDLRITVTPFIEFMGIVVQAPAQVDSTSLSITINPTAGIDKFDSNNPFAVECIPNPFSDITKIGFYTKDFEIIELRVFNLIGQTVYMESMLSQSGKNYFGFNGQNLDPGTYIYSILSETKKYTQRFIKLK